MRIESNKLEEEGVLAVARQICVAARTAPKGKGVDKTIFYNAEGRKERMEADANGDGKVDQWVSYYPGGKMKEIGYDTDKSGKPNVWQLYNEDGTKGKAGFDTVGDGKPDKWQ